MSKWMGSSSRPLRGVNFVLTRLDGKRLMQKRCAKAPTCPNLLCFPGGGIEGNESALWAVLREIFEETGLMLSETQVWILCDFEYELHGQLFVNRFFHASVGDIHVATTEGEMIWMSDEEIAQHELALGESILLPYLPQLSIALYG